MKVYQVWGSQYDEWYKGNVYVSRELAEAECEVLNKQQQKQEVWDIVYKELQKIAWDMYPFPENGDWNSPELTLAYRKQEDLLKFMYDDEYYCRGGAYMFVWVTEIDVLESLPEDLNV